MQQPLVIAVADNATRRVPTWKPGLRSIDVLTRPANIVGWLSRVQSYKKSGKRKKKEDKNSWSSPHFSKSKKNYYNNPKMTLTILCGSARETSTAENTYYILKSEESLDSDFLKFPYSLDE